MSGAGNQFHVVSFSGGKDSTAMLLMMIERGVRVDQVVFCDTTKEFPAIYDHIERVKKMISPIRITTAVFDYDYYFSEHMFTKGKRTGERGYGWPFFGSRWCTGEKISALKKAMLPHSTEFIGIAADEYWRTKKASYKGRDVRFPLVEWGITEAMALAYCQSRGLTFGGLYGKKKRVSCWCCPLQGIGDLRTLHNDFPDLWARLKVMDEKSTKYRFRQDYTLQQLERRFAAEEKQQRLSFVEGKDGNK